MMETVIGSILLGGVLLSGAFLAIGLLWQYMLTGQEQFVYSLTQTNLFQFWISNIHEIRQLAFQPRLFLNLGIAVLMFTPYLRVATSLVYFVIVERNMKYTFFTGFVFAILTYSLLLR